MLHDVAHLLDILEAAKLAVEYASVKSEEEFINDPQCQDAVIRRLEIIGEAARRVSKETKAALPELPWNEMMALRNVLIHEYDDVDMVVVWETLNNDLPQLITSIERILQTIK